MLISLVRVISISSHLNASLGREVRPPGVHMIKQFSEPNPHNEASGIEVSQGKL